MTELVLARHGRTGWSEQGRYTGVSNVGLDALGHQQSRRLADWAGTAGLTAVFCSPMLRATQTAAGAAEAAGLSLGADDRLREVDFGIAEGRRRDELDPESVRRFEADPVRGAFPGAEDPVGAADRVTACLSELAGLDGKILVVAHNTLLRLALCALLGIPLSEYRRRLPLIEHDTVSTLTLGPAGAALRSYNVPLIGSAAIAD